MLSHSRICRGTINKIFLCIWGRWWEVRRRKRKLWTAIWVGVRISGVAGQGRPPCAGDIGVKTERGAGGEGLSPVDSPGNCSWGRENGSTKGSRSKSASPVLRGSWGGACWRAVRPGEHWDVRPGKRKRVGQSRVLWAVWRMWCREGFLRVGSRWSSWSRAGTL